MTKPQVRKEKLNGEVNEKMMRDVRGEFEMEVVIVAGGQRMHPLH